MIKYLIILLLPLELFSQDITGLWKGTLYNDSSGQTLHYEMAISEKKGKLSGYSYTTFIIDGKPVVGVKSIKIVKRSDRFVFADDELLYNNYPVPAPKGVKQISALAYEDTAIENILRGEFITTRTRQYGRQVTGKVLLERLTPLPDDKLISTLSRLDLLSSLSFLAQKVANVKVAITGDDNKEKPVSTDIAGTKNETGLMPEVSTISKGNPLGEVRKRTIETIETIYFTSDSLQVALYDNGFVDGDSVSLIVNGELLLEHQLLSTQAINYSIKTPASSVDSLNIIMYAENLGSIAPNSGLLIIYDGTSRHEISFSGDLEKNASILLKRRKY